jgi:hypothetical protein
MANTPATQNASRSRQNRFFILLLVLASLSSVAKDFDRLLRWTSGIQGLTTSWLHLDSTVHASGMPARLARPALLSNCSTSPGQTAISEQFRWAGTVAQGQSIEIKGINGAIDAEPAPGGEVEVVAIKRGRRSDPAGVAIKVVPHANGVTICAVYPSDDADQPNTCEPGDGRGHSNVRDNDVNVNFKVRVPAGISFIGRTVNGEISATSLTGNVDSRTVNGSINLSTTGYACAKTVNGEITAKLGRADWPEQLEFKTVNGGIDLDLPASLNTKIEADTFNGERHHRRRWTRVIAKDSQWKYPSQTRWLTPRKCHRLSLCLVIPNHRLKSVLQRSTC